MPKLIDLCVKYVQHPYIKRPEKVEVSEDQFRDYVQKIYGLIRTETGHDFSNYKQNTIRRRIERRMAVHQINKIADYVRYLQQTRAEVEILFKDMLIGVTNFFRDPDAFRVLKEKAIPDLLKEMPDDSAIRVWVAGCSTGEEAYSIAMLFEECMDIVKKRFNIQIFASDIDSEAIDFARTAVYPDSIAADVSPERLGRFFTKEDNTYKVRKETL